MKWFNHAKQIFQDTLTQSTVKTSKTNIQEGFSGYSGGLPRTINEIQEWMEQLSFLLEIPFNDLLGIGFLSADDIGDILNGTLTATPTEVATLIKNSPIWTDYQRKQKEYR